MKRCLGLFIIFGLVPAWSAADAKDAHWVKAGPEIIAALDVDAQGQVTASHIQGEGILPQLQELVDQTTRGWKFVPATVDGRAVPARTYAWLVPEMQQSGDKIALRARYELHGPGPELRMIPVYPASMVHDRVQASLIVDATVEADGSYDKITLTSAKTSGGKPAQAFYAEANKAFSQWRAKPEMVDGRAVATRVRVPVNFCLNGTDGKPVSCSEGLTRAVDSPMTEPPAAMERSATFQTLPMDMPIALDSPLKLTTGG